jgi:tetratricopeptide (TPR) repeat protein
MASPFIAITRERFVLAQVLEREGKRDDALRWYNSFSQTNIYDLIYLAPARLARARMLEKLGQPAEAANQYRGVIALWKDADPELQPMVSEARGRLSALSGER